MENIDAPKNENTVIVQTSNEVNIRFKKPKPLVVVIGIVGILILVALFFAKGLFVVAMVDGSHISRLALVQELEKQGGKQVLEAMVDEKLIETALEKQNVSIPQEEMDEEIKKIETQVVSQGITLKDALAKQGMTEENLREKILMQKKLEKILADKIAVTEADVDAYIKENKIIPPKDLKTEDFKMQVSDQLKQQKFQLEIQRWTSNLMAEAKISYFVEY